MTRILLADNNPDLRSALRLLLKTRFGLEFIFDASDMEGILAQLEDAHPDCVILDWELPGCPQGERIPLLRSRLPGLKVIALSLRPESETSARESGVEAFVCKTEPPSVILNAIQTLCRLERQQK
ncbi:MAG TPA: response regulator transcription factor [Anaerolineales bacterium]|nr:response regulator transcription factor [Anaerolineales bacterium]